MREYSAAGSTVNFVLTDHLGSTSVTLDAQGNRVAELRYTAWGETRFSQGTTPTSYRYTGQREDAGLPGLYFYQSRWYFSTLGRFLQADTIVPQPYDPMDYDRYSYVRNNPTRYTDSSGHCIDGITTWACIIAIVGIVAKVVDYGWTAYDGYQSGRVIADPNASRGDKMMAGLNVSLAVLLEAAEPDDLLPAGLPLDDAARKAVMKGAKGAFEEGGEAALEKYIRDNLGEHADDVLKRMGIHTSNFAGPEKLLDHFKKHGAEFGYQTVDEYLQGARVLTSGGNGIETFTRANGDKLFYNAVTNEFAVLSKDGVIRTFFKPVEGLDYWLGQIGKK